MCDTNGREDPTNLAPRDHCRDLFEKIVSKHRIQTERLNKLIIEPLHKIIESFRAISKLLYAVFSTSGDPLI